MTTKRTVKTRVDGVKQAYFTGTSVKPREAVALRQEATPAPLAPAVAVAPTVPSYEAELDAQAQSREGVLRAMLGNGYADTLAEAVAWYDIAGVELDAEDEDRATPPVPESAQSYEDEHTRLLQLLAKYIAEWPALEPDTTSATPLASIEELKVHKFAATTEILMRDKYGVADAHERVLRNRSSVRVLFTERVKPEVAAWRFSKTVAAMAAPRAAPYSARLDDKTAARAK